MTNELQHESSEQRLRIAALVPYKIFPANMGGQKGIAFFYQYLSQLLPVTIITTTNNKAPQGFKAMLAPLLGNSQLRYINPFLFFKIKRKIRENNISHFIIEHPYFGWLAFLLKKATSIKLIVHSHNIEAVRFKSTGRWWWGILWHYEKFTHRLADMSFFKTAEDMEFAIDKFSLKSHKCSVVTYGFDLNKAPEAEDRSSAKEKISAIHSIRPGEKILFFNGTLNYKPNLDAVNVILHHINPLLLAEPGFNYKIIICGRDLPQQYDSLKSFSDKNIIYAGFVEDINTYFMGSDIFINPVIEGGGIKTKLVEALGSGLSCVSTKSGAIGMPLSVTGSKLTTVEDGDWKNFAMEVVQMKPGNNIPPVFFDHFYWGSIAEKAARIIKSVK